MLAVTTVAIRLIGVWLIVQAVPLLVLLVDMASQVERGEIDLTGPEDFGRVYAGQVALQVSYIVIGIGLLGVARPLAGLLAPKDALESTLDSRGLVEAGTILIALWLLGTGVVTFVETSFRLGGGFLPWNWRLTAPALTSVIMALLMLLIARAGAVGRWLKGARPMA